PRVLMRYNFPGWHLTHLLLGVCRGLFWLPVLLVGWGEQRLRPLSILAPPVLLHERLEWTDRRLVLALLHQGVAQHEGGLDLLRLGRLHRQEAREVLGGRGPLVPAERGPAPLEGGLAQLAPERRGPIRQRLALEGIELA